MLGSILKNLASHSSAKLTWTANAACTQKTRHWSSDREQSAPELAMFTC